MKYIQKYDDYINEGIDFNIDILKLILVVGISTLLGKLIIIFIKRFKSNLGKKLLGTFDPVLQNKIKNYEDSLESKFDKKELDELFQTFYSDNVVQSYIKKINDAQFFVTSGIRPGGPPIKTTGDSEILCIHIKFK